MERVSRTTLFSYSLALLLSLLLSLFPVNIQDTGAPDDGNDEAAIGTQHAVLLPWSASHVGAALVLTAIAVSLLLVGTGRWFGLLTTTHERSATVLRLHVWNIRAPPWAL